jgi:hypothetical protein
MAKYRRLFNKIAPNPVSRRNVFLNWHQPSRRVGVPYHSQDYVSAVLPIGEASTAGCGSSIALHSMACNTGMVCNGIALPL